MPRRTSSPPRAGKRRALHLMLLACLLPMNPGCSGQPRTYPAAGTVRLKDGQVLQGGRIELRSLTSPYTARGTVNANGEFRLTTFSKGDGAIAGAHQVIVTAALVLTTSEPGQHLEHAQEIDPRFSRYDTTTLEVTIDPSKTNESIDIRVE